jgi:hypothetical protein
MPQLSGKEPILGLNMVQDGNTDQFEIRFNLWN